MDFLFSTPYTTPFFCGKIQIGLLHLLCASTAMSNTPYTVSYSLFFGAVNDMVMSSEDEVIEFQSVNFLRGTNTKIDIQDTFDEDGEIENSSDDSCTTDNGGCVSDRP